jgi:serine/threonine protein phosphatase PrpC
MDLLGKSLVRNAYRNYNEDRVSIVLNIQKPADKQDCIYWPKIAFFGIFDGHGGTR